MRLPRATHLEVSAVVKEGHAPEDVEQFILEEIDELREGEISDHELQKVKNQALADSIRGLKSSLGLMFQLAVYETWYEWEQINEAPKRTLAVTIDDIRRVLTEYFDPQTRTVAIYRTKEGTPTEEVDPELAALLAELPPEAAPRIKGMIKQLQESEDMKSLQLRLQMMEQAAAGGQVPDEQRPLFDYMIKVIEIRVAELEAAQEEAE